MIRQYHADFSITGFHWLDRHYHACIMLSCKDSKRGVYGKSLQDFTLWSKGYKKGENVMAVGRNFVCTSSFLLSRLLTSRCFSFSFEQHCKKKDSCMHDTTVLFYLSTLRFTHPSIYGFEHA